jgi:hypothetical protein
MSVLPAQVFTTTGANFPWAVFLISFLIGIAAYIYVADCFMKMAQRLGVPNGWFAFIPFLNYWLLCQMAQKENSWFIIMLIFSFCFFPVTFVMMILVLMDVSARLGFESYWGILFIIPIFNFYVVYKLAFTNP